MLYFFFFNDTATTEIYTLSLHDALPIFRRLGHRFRLVRLRRRPQPQPNQAAADAGAAAELEQPPETGGERGRSEEHTSELQSRQYLVCRLLLEKKKKNYTY